MKPIAFLLLLFLVQTTVRSQPVPHHFEGISVLPDHTTTVKLNGSLSNIFNLTGTVSNRFRHMFDLYPIETSEDLVEWKPLTTLWRTNYDTTPLFFHDTNTVALNKRFYRTFTNFLLTASYEPSGPYAVGMVDRVMVDPARTNMYRYTPQTNAFMVTFWYPADQPGAGILPVFAWDRRIAAETNMYISAGYEGRWAWLSPYLVGHSYRNVSMTVGTNKFPVVLSSHGLPAFRKFGSHNAEELASHGYVVVAIDHADCWATEFPDNRYLQGNHSGDITNRLKDMTFLLDKLAELNLNDPLFSGRLDLDRIGVQGGSYGGTVVATCCTDNRVKCAVLYDATNIKSLCPEGLQKPFLVGVGESNFFYTEDYWLYSKATTKAVFLQIRGAGHNTPCDVGWTGEAPQGRGPAMAMDACRLWAFDTYLKGETRDFPSNQEICNVNRK